MDLCPFGTNTHVGTVVDDANVPNNGIKLGFGPSDKASVKFSEKPVPRGPTSVHILDISFI